MGVYAHTYVGVYLEFSVGLKPVKKIAYRDPTTKKKMDTPFNPRTGEKAIEEEYEDVEMIVPSPYITDNDNLGEDTFTRGGEYQKDNKRVFMLNERNTGYGMRINEEDFSHNLVGIDINGVIASFKIEYAKYLEYYTKKYGDFNVCYGVVHYYS